MKKITEIVDSGVDSTASLTLPFDLRQKSRVRIRVDSGEEMALQLPRGIVLRHGDRLRADDGQVIEVRAAPESVSTAHSSNPVLIARACYHLGNRHVPLQITPYWVRYAHDHVLDAMIRDLGLLVDHEDAPFEPESGAYSGGGHHHH